MRCKTTPAGLTNEVLESWCLLLTIYLQAIREVERLRELEVRRTKLLVS